jgi:hypothetical protein
MKEVQGLTYVYGYDALPAAIGNTPTMLIIPLEGEFDYGVGGPFIAHHEIQATLYITNQIVPAAYAKAVPFIERIRDKIAGDITLDSNVVHILPSSQAPFYDGPGGITYNGKQYLGVIFRFEVKERESYTVAA